MFSFNISNSGLFKYLIIYLIWKTYIGSIMSEISVVPTTEIAIERRRIFKHVAHISTS